MVGYPTLHKLATLACAAAVSACSGMNPAGLIAASRLDPLNTAPSEIAVAVGVPQTLRLTDGDAELRIAFRGATEESTILVEEVAPLVLSASDTAGPSRSTSDETVYVARVAPEDATRIAAVQQEIRNLRSAGTDGNGSLTVRVTSGCFVGERPATIAVSTWIQTNPSDGFVQLTHRQDLTRAVGAQDAEMLMLQLNSCR